MAGQFEAIEHLRRALEAAERTDDLLLIAEISHSIGLASQAIFVRQSSCVRASTPVVSQAANRFSKSDR